MSSVTVRELRDKGGEVLERVERGERVIVTRDGRPVMLLGRKTTARAYDALIAASAIAHGLPLFTAIRTTSKRFQDSTCGLSRIPTSLKGSRTPQCERSVRPVPSHRLAGGTPERDALAAAV
jgi:antitoxin (DNA-binding transcriptional repressor) of toxin-antitoxin stability system